ncbi:MAG: hypothetical protein L0387_02940 [Acidobacteria bacterium]|nr:hypothetical protein [Acidobacteriota bacterium]
MITVCLAFAFTFPVDAVDSQSASSAIPPCVQSALDSLSANSLRGHLSFIASDLLEGRDSPSRGLDLAAEYIAAQFRRAGLEPVGDDGYFQTAHWLVAEQNLRAYRLRLGFEGRSLNVSPEEVSFRLASAVEASSSEVFKLKYGDAAALSAHGRAGTRCALCSCIPIFMLQEIIGTRSIIPTWRGSTARLPSHFG